MNGSAATRSGLTTAALCLGAGVAAAFDGIVLHQILGWHHMISNVEPLVTPTGVATNLLLDGLFNLFAVGLVGIGFLLFWRAVARRQALPPRRRFVGLLLLGFGLFNLVEGVINHHLLQIHHVREVANPLPWDLGFLALAGLLPLVVGWLLVNRTQGLQVSVGLQERSR
jgi:uncharacterized membrane protein